MLKFQDEVDHKVVEGLNVQVSPAEHASMTSRMTESPEAYNLYVEGRYYANGYLMRLQRDSLRKIRRLAEKAIALDPNFAQAHALMSISYVLESGSYVEGSRENLTQAVRAAQRPVALDPRLAEAYMAAGMAEVHQGKRQEAIQTL